MPRPTCLLAALLFALPLPACGGGGGGGGGAAAAVPVGVTMVSDESRDGYLGYISSAASRIRNLVNSIGVGDNEGYAARRSIRGFVSFDLRALPAGARVISATLRMYQTSVAGEPYRKLGEIRADHVDYGDALDYDEFATPFLGSSTVGIISRDPTLGWKEIDVTERVLEDLAAGRTRSQYRLRFGIRYSGDATTDWARFEDGDMSQGTSNPPLLSVQYVMP